MSRQGSTDHNQIRSGPSRTKWFEEYAVLDPNTKVALANGPAGQTVIEVVTKVFESELESVSTLMVTN